MKVSIIITYYDPLLKKVAMLSDLLKSIAENTEPTEGEIVFVTNGGSYVESVNQGLSRATGDWLIVLNDDVVIQDPQWLKKLCVPDVLSSWRQTSGSPDAACFAMSREVFGKLGLMDERYRHGFNYEDTDYFMTARKLGIPFRYAGVEMRHLGEVTTKTYLTEDSKNEKVELNRRHFIMKWGDERL